MTVLKKLLVVAIPITIGASVMPLVNMIDNVIVIDRLMVAGYTHTQALKMFGQLTGMAMSIVNLPSVITVAMSMSLVPAISEAFALGNKVNEWYTSRYGKTNDTSYCISCRYDI